MQDETQKQDENNDGADKRTEVAREIDATWIDIGGEG